MTRKSKDFSFVNGLNLAWIEFGRDTGVDPVNPQKYFRPDMVRFEEAMDFACEHGATLIRWWYHTNGSTNPVFDAHKKVTPNPDFFHEDVKKILDLAQQKKLQVQICLWSFDMLKKQWGVDPIANKKLITEDTFTQAYIENALVPLVKYIGNHSALFAWEIFNEPEGMTNKYAQHWPGFEERVEMKDIQKFINRVAGAIRKTEPQVKITNGALGFLTNVDDPKKGFYNAYSDANLFDKGKNDLGYLDFYNIHYYSWARSKGSPFHTKYSPKLIDKPAIIGEYYPDDLSFKYKVGDNDHKLDIFPASDLGTILIENQWAGSIAWSWTDRKSKEERNRMASIIHNVAESMVQTSHVGNEVVEDIKIYPNPAKEVMHITGVKKGEEIIIYDFTGKIVKKKRVRNTPEKILISELYRGYYRVMVVGRIQLSLYKE